MDYLQKIKATKIEQLRGEKQKMFKSFSNSKLIQIYLNSLKQSKMKRMTSKMKWNINRNKIITKSKEINKMMKVINKMLLKK